MNAIILAAGVGSRLRPITNYKPKTMVELNGKPILSYILQALSKAKIANIIICTGYKEEIIKRYCQIEFHELPITFVSNSEYETTNNMYSLYLARKYITDDFLLLNADVVFDPSIIDRIAKVKSSCVLVDLNHYYEESMKIRIRMDGTISSISKNIRQDEFYATSIDIYKFCKKDIPVFLDELSQFIQLKGKKQWTEVLLDKLFGENKIIAKPLSIGKAKWFEIDNFEDLSRAELIFNKELDNLKNKKVIFLDRDGTIINGSNQIPGANDFLIKARKKGMKIFLLTNNSSKTRFEHWKSIKKSGIEIYSNEIILSTDICISELKKLGFSNLFWIANKSVNKYLIHAGFVFDDKNPQAVLLTYDNTITYKKLIQIISFIKKDLPYFATHIDKVCPTEDGLVPDIGSFIDIIKLCTMKTPIRTFGKPGLEQIDSILCEINLKYEDSIIIGDRLYTDIKVAQGNAITSVLVLSGETTRTLYEASEIRADIIVDSIKDLIEYI